MHFTLNLVDTSIIIFLGHLPGAMKDGIIWVIDSIDRWRLDECKRQLYDILKQEV